MPTPRQHADNAAKQRVYRQRQAEARKAEREQKGLPTAAPIPTMPSASRWTTALAHAYELLQRTQDEMQNYYDERSETWQESDKGEEFQRQLDTLESIISELDDMR
jgi:hypothetical protein